jgi:hypothetical protein
VVTGAAGCGKSAIMMQVTLRRSVMMHETYDDSGLSSRPVISANVTPNSQLRCCTEKAYNAITRARAQPANTDSNNSALQYTTRSCSIAGLTSLDSEQLQHLNKPLFATKDEVLQLADATSILPGPSCLKSHTPDAQTTLKKFNDEVMPQILPLVLRKQAQSQWSAKKIKIVLADSGVLWAVFSGIISGSLQAVISEG